tara:strand:+ start:532 stop:753 length:222 start_codon:yes stop_codon:yes gene_type:complete
MTTNQSTKTFLDQIKEMKPGTSQVFPHVGYVCTKTCSMRQAVDRIELKRPEVKFITKHFAGDWLGVACFPAME